MTARRPVLQRTTSIDALLENGSDQTFRQFVQDVLGVCVRLQALRDTLGTIAGITGPQYALLVGAAHLQRGASGVTVSRLAQHIHVSGTFVTAESNKLQRRGYLRKRANPDDGRSVLVSVTNRGRRLLDDLLPVIRAANDEIFADISRHQYRVLRGWMAQMVASTHEALLMVDSLDRKRRRHS